MKERRPRPLIFSGPMVRALLGGWKTMTRRLCKLPKEPEIRGGWEPTTTGGKGSFYADGSPAPEMPAIWNQTTGTTIISPYLPGDRIWVRETWCRASADALVDDPQAIDGRPRGPADEFGIRPFVYYKATDLNVVHVDDEERSPWKSPLHMPRWASRLEFEVVSSRAERLKDLSREDAIAEGARRFVDIPPSPTFPNGVQSRWSMEEPPSCDHCLGSPRTAFGNFFNKLYAGENWNLKDGPSPWDLNPFVWVIALKAVPHG